MNLEILKVSWTAFKTVWHTMSENEYKHPGNEWKHISKRDHLGHIGMHLYNMEKYNDEDHAGHALTRLAMIKYLSR